MDEARSAFRRFARAHLRSRAQRALYVALPAADAVHVSVAEIAAAAHVGEHEADQLLRRFAAAGIVEVVVEGSTRSYRLAADVATGEVDPVCGMVVPVGAGHVLERDGSVVRFCSLGCLVAWRARGAGWIAGNPQANPGLSADAAPPPGRR